MEKKYQNYMGSTIEKDLKERKKKEYEQRNKKEICLNKNMD